jgi:hypothetical protein
MSIHGYKAEPKHRKPVAGFSTGKHLKGTKIIPSTPKLHVPGLHGKFMQPQHIDMAGHMVSGGMEGQYKNFMGHIKNAFGKIGKEPALRGSKPGRGKISPHGTLGSGAPKSKAARNPRGTHTKNHAHKHSSYGRTLS